MKKFSLCLFLIGFIISFSMAGRADAEAFNFVTPMSAFDFYAWIIIGLAFMIIGGAAYIILLYKHERRIHR